LGGFGSQWYFRLEGVEDSYKFARADDMDAFLWFVIHKGKFPNSSLIDNIHDIGNTHGTPTTTTPSDGTLLSALTVKSNDGADSSILLGNTFTYRNSPHVISMCIDRKLDKENKTVENTLVPTTDDWTSVNWYIRRADQLGKNLGFGWGSKNGRSIYKGNGRDFSKEKGICNIQYIDQSSSDAPLVGLVNNKFRFTILPKPVIHIPQLSKGEAPWGFKKLLFNDKGEYDKNGKYTLADIYESDDLTYLNGNVKIDPKSGKVTVENKDEVVKNLIECYPGLTVYEFNYDYVMGMKLFDAKVLVHTLLETVLNSNMGVGFSVGIKQQEGTEKIKEIIKNILESDDSSVNDCYYTFDNSKYDALLAKAAEKRKGNDAFSGIAETLNEYDSNAELQEQIDVLHRAITQAAVTVSDGVDDVDKVNVEFNFIFDLIEALVTSIVHAILSPKVMMLLEVNQKLMGGTWEKFSMEDLLKALQELIVSIVREVRDLVAQELMKLVLKALEPIIETLGAIIIREQLEKYADIILEIVNNCPSVWLKFGNKFQDTTLDTVDYADIDTTVNEKDNMPSINNC